MKFKLLSFMMMLSSVSFAQSNFEKVIKGGEVLLNGIAIFKAAKPASLTKTDDVKPIPTVCIKNQLLERITFIMIGTDKNDNQIKKELVIPKEGKECLFEIPKGIYTYEVILANKEIYKKGEYKFLEELTMVIKE